MSPDPVLKKARQCSAVATRQSTDVNVGKEKDKGKGLSTVRPMYY